MTLRFERPAGRELLVVGLTGGIATGKSTVAGMFRELGALVIDADAIVHELLEPGGAAVAPVIATFGQSVRTAEDGVNRERLAALVFHDELARRRLEALVHPLVIAESNARLAGIAHEGGADLALYDAALLVETGRFRDFHRLIVVATRPEIQFERLIARGGLTPEQAGARIHAQAPIERKAALADYVIDNSTHWNDTRRQVAEVWVMLLEDVDALRDGQPLPPRRAAS